MMVRNTWGITFFAMVHGHDYMSASKSYGSIACWNTIRILDVDLRVTRKSHLHICAFMYRSASPDTFFSREDEIERV